MTATAHGAPGTAARRRQRIVDDGVPVAIRRRVFHALSKTAMARNVTTAELCRRLLATIADDGLVDAVLDDEVSR